MHVRCPHCQNRIELVDDTPIKEVVCSSCGSGFRLEPGTSTGLHPTVKGKRLGKFELVDTVGLGAFGTVYMARDTELDRTVALKIPRSGNIASDEDLDRFAREARAVAQLSHPGIVPVYEACRVEGTPMLVSEFVWGVTLADRLSSGERPTTCEAAELVAALADALQCAHAQGIVHRDVKPSNVLLDSNGSKPRLTDFGLAKRDAGEITMTLDGQVLGTPAYMSPEQAAGEAHRVDGRSDIYSLGVILYELLTGELPFRGTKRMLLHQVMNEEPRPPRRLNEHIPRDLETVCRKAMAKEPGRRYMTAGDLRDDLRRCVTGEPIQARPVGRLERLWRWTRRKPAIAALIVTVVFTLLAGTAVSTHFAIEERKHAREAETNFRQIRHAVDTYFTKVSQSTLLDAPALQPLRKELLETALSYYQSLLTQRHDDPSLQAELAAAHLRAVDVMMNASKIIEVKSAGFEQLN